MTNKKSKLLIILPIIILLMAIPMTFWCYAMLQMKSTDVNYPLVSLGCLIAIVIYLFSIIIGILGIIAYKKDKYKVAKILSILCLIISLADIYCLKGYVIFTLLPLIVILLIYSMSIQKVVS